MITRRKLLKGLLGTILAGLFVSAYGFFIEPVLRLRVRRWSIASEGWRGAPLRIAIISDVHVAEPWVSLSRLQRIVQRTNALGADIIFCLGDLEGGHRFVTRKVDIVAAASVLGGLSAPLGVLAVLGNHDWWHDRAAQARGAGPTLVGTALEENGVPVLSNAAIRVGRAGGDFWVAGLEDQLAFPLGGGRYRGLDDFDDTLAQVTDEAPVILLAHEPDIFPRVPDRVCLTLSGHTHGGQVRFFGWSPVVPSRYGNRYAYGHVREAGRDLVVSGGIGCSILPVRLGVVPEITLVELSAGQ
ncbi:metallophosphoesterase [Frigidibacter sp. RF13]|uniref:metallophosphoesterase n=1 Tax=Frigidibacter sp. RF13 TaxID=2997340 RepID=UPI0022700CF4|nr:metallophosphoesterase [Frigidibacter sp. RF13]MCY1127100.1 metallophosphoesterase [Frigidibacter sp. RF13]